MCSDPEIDPITQQPIDCKRINSSYAEVLVDCMPAPGIECSDLSVERTFKMPVKCKWTNEKSFETALLLSIFLGMFGVDRFYLGYPAIGLLKFCTLGFMFLGQLVDIILIATQIVGPADGSSYVIDYYGAVLTRLVADNLTHFKQHG